MAKSRPDRRRRAAPAAVLATWHRRLGIAAALLVVWLAATGILLSHTDDIGLDERHARAGWLLDWYGIEAPANILGYRVGEHWVTQVGERIYFDQKPLRGEHGELLGAVSLGEEIAAAAGERILLLTPEGVLAEALGRAHGVPAEMRGIAVHQGNLAVRTARGVYTAGHGLLDWRPAEAPNVQWSQPSAVPEPLRARLAADYRGRILTLERVLLDLHSGRLLGNVGVLVMDLAAVAFLGLAFTGFWMWLKRNNGRAPGSAGRK